jgi:hypothetical protein
MTRLEHAVLTAGSIAAFATLLFAVCALVAVLL